MLIDCNNYYNWCQQVNKSLLSCWSKCKLLFSDKSLLKCTDNIVKIIFI